uniref:Uncharacterized protein n=1 Tax=Ditylenchus dipsaci TaxID=166011 RepID=A0A915E5C7_9BILA
MESADARERHDEHRDSSGGLELGEDSLLLSNVQFSKASIFQILFSQLVKPEMVQFSGIQGISGESFSRALNSLPGLQLATTVVVLPVVNFLHNYGTTKYRRLVTDFNLLSGGFDGIVHRLFEKFGSDSNTCPYELIVFVSTTSASNVPFIQPIGHQMYPGMCFQLLLHPSSMLIVRRGFLLMANTQLVHSQRIGRMTVPLTLTEDGLDCYSWTKRGRTVTLADSSEQVYLNCAGYRAVIDKKGAEKQPIKTLKFNLTTNQFTDSLES